MTYDPRTGRGMMDYQDVREQASEALRLLQKSYDETGQRPLESNLVRVEAILSRIIGATPVMP